MAIEATYGWYWAVDALQDAGLDVHLVAPSKVSAFDDRRVKNDQRDCQLLGDLLRAGMLPEAWIAPPEVREWRELVRYRAKLVGLRSGLKAQAHAVLAKLGVQVPMSDLFGVGGRHLLAHLCANDPRFHSAFGQRIESLVVLVEAFDHEIDELSATIAHLYRDHAGYRAIQRIDGIGPITAAILVAEIGDVTRFASRRSSGVVVRADATRIASPTPRSSEGRSPNRAAGSCAGQRSKPPNSYAATRCCINAANSSPSGATTARSPRSRSLGGSSRSPTTGCATATSAASSQPREPTKTRGQAANVAVS